MSFIVGAIIGGVAAVGGAAIASKGAKRGGEIAAAGSDREIEFNRESRDLARSDQAPYREAGYTALDALMSMTGLSGPKNKPLEGTVIPRREINTDDYMSGWGGRIARSLALRAGGGSIGIESRANGGGIGPMYGWDGGRRNRIPPPKDYNVNEVGPESIYEGGGYTRSSDPRTISTNSTGYVQPNENPGGVEGGYNFQTEPGYNFRIGEGSRALERGASARGGLLSGGFGRRITRYAQDYASNEYNNVYNRISNIAGLGQVSATSSGNAALAGGQLMGRAASEGALSSAYARQGSANAWAGAVNEIGQLPWGEVKWPWVQD